MLLIIINYLSLLFINTSSYVEPYEICIMPPHHLYSTTFDSWAPNDYRTSNQDFSIPGSKRQGNGKYTHLQLNKLLKVFIRSPNSFPLFLSSPYPTHFVLLPTFHFHIKSISRIVFSKH